MFGKVGQHIGYQAQALAAIVRGNRKTQLLATFQFKYPRLFLNKLNNISWRYRRFVTKLYHTTFTVGFSPPDPQLLGR